MNDEVVEAVAEQRVSTAAPGPELPTGMMRVSKTDLVWPGKYLSREQCVG